MIIRYIGHRPSYRDSLYGTGDWLYEQEKEVPEAIGGRMSKHVDVYLEVAGNESAKSASIEVVEVKEKAETEDEDQSARDAVAAMDSKEAVAEYAQINFGMAINKKFTLENMKQQATTLIDQYGAR